MSESTNSIAPPVMAEGVTPSCVVCAYSFKVVAQGEIQARYECRCAPPQVAPVYIQENRQQSPIACKSVFPLVTEAMWCFQFAPRVPSSTTATVNRFSSPPFAILFSVT